MILILSITFHIFSVTSKRASFSQLTQFLNKNNRKSLLYNSNYIHKRFLRMNSLDSLQFDNRNLRKLPVEGTSSTSQYVNLFTSGFNNDQNPKKISRKIKNAIFSYTELQPVKNPEIVCISPEALSLLGLPLKELNEYTKAELKQMALCLSGSLLLPGSDPYAHCYCGHQFGSFAGQLGDGAAMYLGEVVHNNKRWELQLKGAGVTPFSRSSDGRKVLRSSIREFLCSEAMYYLNIPTTRAGAVVTSDTTVERDPFYNGNNILEKCTVVSRIAPNFFRFGSFEIFKQYDDKEGGSEGPSAGNDALKKQLLDYVSLYFPRLSSSDQHQQQQQHNSSNNNNSNSNNDSNNNEQSVSTTSAEQSLYLSLYREIVMRTALLVSQWQSVGFVHGVLNTDNMSLMGVTIDYGPFGFMEYFDPMYTPNGSDNSGRYTYENQPAMCKWNLQKLAEALHPLLPLGQSLPLLHSLYDQLYEKEYMYQMACKLGFPIAINSKGTAAAVTGTGGTGSSSSDDKQSDIDVNSATYASVHEYDWPSAVTDTMKLLLKELTYTLEDTAADYTDTFQALTDFMTQFNQLPPVAYSTPSSSDTALVEPPPLTISEQNLIEKTILKIISRCATPQELLQLNKRKLSITRLGMNPNQVMQILHLIDTQPPSVVEELFNGASIDVIKAELLTEKKKIDSRAQLVRNIAELEESLASSSSSSSAAAAASQTSVTATNSTSTNAATATPSQGGVSGSSSKQTKDAQSWQQWLAMYVSAHKQYRAYYHATTDDDDDDTTANTTATTTSVTNTNLCSTDTATVVKPLTLTLTPYQEASIQLMLRTNPSFILRNWVAQEAIVAAERSNDFSKVQTVFKMLKQPYDRRYSVFSTYATGTGADSGSIGTASLLSSAAGGGGASGGVSVEEQQFVKPPPSFAQSLICTCSS